MNKLINNVYYIAKVSKLVIQIGSDNDNIHLLAKSNKNILDNSKAIYALKMILHFPKYKKLREQRIIDRLTSFYCKKPNRMIICKENPYEMNS